MHIYMYIYMHAYVYTYECKNEGKKIHKIGTFTV